MTSPENAFLSDRQLATRYATHRATIWRWAAAGRFPQPVTLSPGCTRWRAADVAAFEAAASPAARGTRAERASRAA